MQQTLHRSPENNNGSGGKFFAAVKKTAASIGAFFKALGLSIAGGLKGLFKRKSKPHQKNDNTESAASGETQVIGSVREYLGPSREAHSKPEKKARVIPHISKEHLSGEGKEHVNIFRPQRPKQGIFLGVTLTTFKLILIAIMMVGAAGLGTLVGVAKGYMETTPTLDTGKIEDQSETSYIYDANNQIITAYTGVENRDWATIEEIPLQLQQAVVAIEDVRFYFHSGVDVKRLVGAFMSNLMNSSVQGGSTLTQQLVKNTLLTFERTYKRKIQEAYLAMQLEETYSKEEILEAYVNSIHLGASNYGVKTAAKDYFGKELGQLTLRECAMLAGITQYPYQYNPRRCYYDIEKPEVVNNRTDEVLRKMYTAGFITLEEYEAAKEDSVFIIKESEVAKMYEMPYFVEYAVHDVVTHFLKQRGMQDTKQNRAQIETELRTNGYKIYTTVDPQIQKTVEETLLNWDQYPRLENSGDGVVRDETSGTDIIQPQAAAVVLDHTTGELKAVVGGRTTPEMKKSFNRAYQSKMPIGSTAKPIAVYAPAIDKGYSDGTVIPNLPIPIDGWDSERGYPVGGASQYGPVTLRTGLVSSLNSATAYALLHLVKPQDSYNYLVQMGINPSDINQTGAGLALGASGITPIELAGAFGTIANSGVYLEPLSFRYVLDRNGNKILDADEIREERAVFKESTAWLVTDMLVEAVTSGTGKQANISDMTIGGKTGTNQDSKGVLFAGISPYYTSTVWIGHDYYKPLHNKVYASSSAAPLWKAYMEKILEGKEDKPIIDADPASLGLVQVKVCSVSGKLATPACDGDLGGHKPVNAWFVSGTQPTELCDWHYTVPVCEESGKVANQYCPVVGSSRALLLLPADSVYWKLTDEQRSKYLPGVLAALQVEDPLLGNESVLPGSYYCDIHNETWYYAQQQRVSAVANADAQINASHAVLANPDYAMSAADRTQLSGKIGELRNLIGDPLSTAAAIEQVTYELKSLTETLVAIYSQMQQAIP